MLNAIWEALKAIVDEYIFAAEATGKNGEEKKAVVVAALGLIVEQAAAQYKLAAVAVSIIKFFVPILVDAVVAKLNAEGKLTKLNPSTAS